MAHNEIAAAYKRKVESLLADNLMPFWANHAWDDQYGGFLTRLDRQGRRLEDHEKILIMQARMIASLSFAHAHGLNQFGYLEKARAGFEFLVHHFWDQRNGGFHYSVTREGAPQSTRKNTDFHAYTLIGFCEYYRASQDPAALQWANRLFDLLMDQATDRDFGFIEDFDGQPWDVLNAEQMNLGGHRAVKTIDLHTNIMESFTYLARLTNESRHLNALQQVMDLLIHKGIHKSHGCSITLVDSEWNPLTDSQGESTTSYGLNVEIAWLIGEALTVLGRSWETRRDTMLGLIDHALAFGFDHEKGGLAASGPITGHVLEARHLPGHFKYKPWWSQAECMNALLFAYEWTRDPRYWHAFEKLFDWIWRFQIDHECGDWYQETDWTTGAPITTDKGREWKTAFHAGRALIRASHSMQAIGQPSV